MVKCDGTERSDQQQGAGADGHHRQPVYHRFDHRQFNMGVKAFDEFDIGVPEPGYYKEIINSDDAKYAGSGRVNTRQIRAKNKPSHGMPYSITIRMPVVGGAIFRKRPEKEIKRKGK